MILRRITEHVKAQNWTAVALDFFIVVVGVFVGLQVSNWNDARSDRQRTTLMLDTFRVDIRDFNGVLELYSRKVSDGLAAFDNSYARGEKPAPYVLRFRGSDTPPQSVWEAAQQSGLADLVHPSLIFELGYFYSEQKGIGKKFIRYTEFVESEILPRHEDTNAFYNEDGKLKPAYAQNMQRLREWVADSAVLVASSNCLTKRFDKPHQPGPSCRPDYGEFESIKAAQ